MLLLNSTVFTVFVLPYFIGIIIRLIFIKWKKGYILTGAFAALSVIAWIWTKHLTNHGVDGTVMLLTWMSTILTGGSLIVGVISLLIKKIKHKEVS